MSKRDGRFKKLNDDSKILGLGSLFRGLERKNWAINVDFSGRMSKSMHFSNIPVLARKRVLNPTQQYAPAGKTIDFVINNAKAWQVHKASECPAFVAHRHGHDGNQFCFVTNVGRTRIFIPQLEMARVLFYHDPFLARLSLQHNALAEDFMLGQRNDGQPLIVVREGAEYPVSYFNRDDNRRFLSWVLLDRAARASFESISFHLAKYQFQKGNYLHWNFQFAPPPLSNVEFGARGWDDRASNTFFVWEVSKLGGLPSDVEGEIDFYHPGYERRVGGKPTKGDGKQGVAPEHFELDDDELSDSDKATLSLMSEQVAVSFKTPHLTNRIAYKTKAVNNVLGSGDKEILDNDLSPNEKEESGALPGGAWNNLNDETDDIHLYLGKFQSFLNMVAVLEAKHGCEVLNQHLEKLPRVGEGKKHWLSDTQNPRCLALVELVCNDQHISLLEIDTSDNAAKLSTMMIKGVNEERWVHKNIHQIAQGVMKKSLGWPTNLFKSELGKGGFVGIPHPKSKNPGSLPPEEISPWAQRFINWMTR
ncbi:hypothetical protein GCM10011369_16540 [Neiella marina]|uniref:TnsE C-terminal domain-containing protein n=1 Tax=Neiella marina TaxID=508461 RepID=A0A8J2XNW5_9GAMM|nr:Tn7-like element transposition protein TnsE [Neiella marina]GGA75341.1 hypothetical protein GCM10011369_16540 [Neiella marina]